MSPFMAFGWRFYLDWLTFYYIYTTERLWIKGIAQGLSSGILLVLGFELTTYHIERICSQDPRKPSFWQFGNWKDSNILFFSVQKDYHVHYSMNMDSMESMIPTIHLEFIHLFLLLNTCCILQHHNCDESISRLEWAETACRTKKLLVCRCKWKTERVSTFLSWAATFRNFSLGHKNPSFWHFKQC